MLIFWPISELFNQYLADTNKGGIYLADNRYRYADTYMPIAIIDQYQIISSSGGFFKFSQYFFVSYEIGKMDIVEVIQLTDLLRWQRWEAGF